MKSCSTYPWSSVRPKAASFATFVVAILSGCDAQPRLPLASESEHFCFHYEPGGRVEAERLEAHYAWATARLGVKLPRKIHYYRYSSQQQMGEYTGYYYWNGFALPEQFEVHTMWIWDNHEPVHIYSSLLGHPSDFFNEGIAVAFQADPFAGQYDSVFNMRTVHPWAKQRLSEGTLLPLDGMVVTDYFRSITDVEFSYREAGSFLRYLIDTCGIQPLADFIRRSAQYDHLDVIKSRFADAFALSLGESESNWHVFLHNLPAPTP